MALGVGLLSNRRRWQITTRLQNLPPSTIAPIVIGGCGGSGTTLLRHMLNRHPSIFCGPESTVFLKRISTAQELATRFGPARREILEWQRLSRTQVEFIERFRAMCLIRSGKPIWADKTPENVRRFQVIRRWFPQARFIHVIRDGRDVVCSLRQAQWMKLEKITGGVARSSPEAVEACIRYWMERVTFGRTLRRDPRYLEVRYEDLVENTEPVLRRILAFLNVDWDSRVLKSDPSSADAAAGPVYESAIGRWRTELSSCDAEIIKQYAGPLLVDLGYEYDLAWAPLSDTASSVVRSLPGWQTKPRTVRDKAKARFNRLRRDTYALWLAAKDPRVPWLARIVAAFAIGYFVSPIDLIPDWIPVIGYLDDAAVVPLAIALFLKLTPVDLLREHRRAAALRLSRHIWAVQEAIEN